MLPPPGWTLMPKRHPKHVPKLPRLQEGQPQRLDFINPHLVGFLDASDRTRFRQGRPTSFMKVYN